MLLEASKYLLWAFLLCNQAAASASITCTAITYGGNCIVLCLLLGYIHIWTLDFVLLADRLLIVIFIVIFIELLELLLVLLVQLPLLFHGFRVVKIAGKNHLNTFFLGMVLGLGFSFLGFCFLVDCQTAAL